MPEPDYDDYYDDYPELTDEELLAIAVTDDADDALYTSAAGPLWQRQQANFAEIKNELTRRYNRLIEDFDNHQVARVAQWWDLVSIHDLNATQMFEPDWEADIRSSTDYSDLNVWSARSDFVRLVTDYQVWLQFRATSERAHRWIRENFSGSVLEKKNGYWLAESDLIRFPIQFSMTYWDDRDLPVSTAKGLNLGISVMSQYCPPVAGRWACWLPSLAGYEAGVQSGK
jgi:hypothetical protein